MPLAVHVALLRLLGIREKLYDVLDIDDRPGEVVASPDCLKPRGFCGKANGNIKVAHREIYAWELVDVMDYLVCRGVVLHDFEVIHHGGHTWDSIYRVK